MAFVHLHCHSQYSLLDGTAHPSDLADRAAELGMPAVALTDTTNLFGAVEFFKACKEAHVRAVIGTELHVQPEGLAFLDPAGPDGGYDVLALVENALGYRNLCELVTRAIFEGTHFRPRIDLALLEKHREGLIWLTGGSRGVFRDERTAETRFEALARLLPPDRLYVELTSLGLEGEDERNDRARRLAAARGYSLVVTNAVHYVAAIDSVTLDVQHAIAEGALLSSVQRRTPTDQAYFKSEAEMRALFPDDGDALDRTAEIAARCGFAFDFGHPHFPATTPPDGDADTDANWQYFYRAFPPPRDFGLPSPDVQIPTRPDGGGRIEGYFAWYASAGLGLRLRRVDTSLHAAYRERLELELRVIARMGFPAYLLIVAEFINWSKDHGIPVGPGRGSAAGSLAAWAMRITDIDPIRYGLLFERFLNPERVSLPDIDVDFCQDRREEAIRHVREKYGDALVSQIITYGTLKAKAAIRDVARVLGLTFNDADRIAKLVPEGLGITLDDALQQEPRLSNLVRGDPRVRRVYTLARAMEGLCRQTGVHAAGVVIADRPLVTYAPLYRDEPNGDPVVQYDMKSAESIGLIKFDFLGLKTLDQIRDAVAMIERNHGLRVEVDDLSTNDAETYAMLATGDALGVFQLESTGMRELLTRLKPSCIDDMVALVALYRPGPLQAGMVDDFVDRKHGRRVVEYPLPILAEILAPTYGTIIYQEQVMQVAQVMAGYTLGEADLLRRAMGKKKPEEMAQQRSRFVEGSVRNGHPREKAEEIFELLEKFAGYGFNKSHSAAYGLISYQTAWLKAHHRAEFMAALMTIESANADKILEYVADCRRGGIAVLPVCLNRSERQFTAVVGGEEGRAIHFGLAAIKNVGDAAVEAILEARTAAGGKFRSAIDVFERLDYRRVNSRVLDSLIRAGAFDFSGESRAALIAGLEAAMQVGARKQEDLVSGQVGLFAGLMRQPAAFRWPTVPPWPLSQRLEEERKALGLYLTGHPMDALSGDVKRFATVPLSEVAGLDLRQYEDNVRLLGLVGAVRTVRTRSGDKMAFVRLEDVKSAVECTFFSDVWTRSQKVVGSGEPVVLTGRLELRDGEVKLRVGTAELLSDKRASAVREIRVHVGLGALTAARTEQLRLVLRGHAGSCPAALEVVGDDYVARMPLAETLAPSAAMEEAVNSIFGARVVDLV